MKYIFRQRTYETDVEFSFNYNRSYTLGMEYKFQIRNGWSGGKEIEDKLIVEKDIDDDVPTERGSKIFLDELQKTVIIADTSFTTNGTKILYIESKTNKDDTFKEEQANYINGLTKRLEELIKLNGNKFVINQKNDYIDCNEGKDENKYGTCEGEEKKSNFFLRNIFKIKI